MARFLVTGGAGFIGSNIVMKLVEQEHDVVVVDNLSSGREENIDEVKNRIKFVYGDIRNYSTISKAMKGVDYVLHQAAVPSVQRSVIDPVTTHDVNTNGTLNVLLAARDARVKKVVLASSSSIYGDKPTLPKTERMKPSPLSPYAVSKITCEYLLSVFSKLFTLETVSLRYFNVFGPRQDPKSEYAAVIPRFILALLGGGAPVIYGDGLQSRDFTFVEDVVSANLIACTIAGLKGEAFNIACGKRISLLQLLDILYKITGIKVKTVFENARQGDIKHSMADVSMARKCLGFRPGVFLEQGLEKTVSWFRAHMNKERVG